MNIQTYWAWELPEHLDGCVLVVDVYAATSNIASIVSRGAKELMIANDDTVEDIVRAFPGSCVIGESTKYPEHFFACSNAASAVERFDVKGQHIVFMSNNGSRVIESALSRGADAVRATSFVNISAVTQWALTHHEDVTILRAGERTPGCPPEAQEDALCAEAVTNILQGRYDSVSSSVIEKVRQYIVKTYPWSDVQENTGVVTVVDRYPVVPRCTVNPEGFITVDLSV